MSFAKFASFTIKLVHWLLILMPACQGDVLAVTQLKQHEDRKV